MCFPVLVLAFSALTLGGCKGPASLIVSQDIQPQTREQWLAQRALSLSMTVADASARDARFDDSHPSDALWDDEAVRESAAHLWAAHCAACHGARGRNEGVPALDPAPREFGTGAMAMGFAMGRDKMRGGIWRRIRDGSPPHMPAFGEQLANEQLWSLVYFIEHL